METALEALRHENITGWAAPVHPVGGARHGKGSAGKPYRLWVATLRYERAEDIMLQVLNDGR